jgi:hypothetical protein
VASLLWFIVVLLVIAWFFGFSVNVGWWIHLLLVLALLGILYNLLLRPILATTGRSTTHVDDTHTHDPHGHTHTTRTTRTTEHIDDEI